MRISTRQLQFGWDSFSALFPCHSVWSRELSFVRGGPDFLSLCQGLSVGESLQKHFVVEGISSPLGAEGLLSVSGRVFVWHHRGGSFSLQGQILQEEGEGLLVFAASPLTGELPSDSGQGKSDVSSVQPTFRGDEVGPEQSEFLATLSHELRTPLNAILGMTELAQKETNPEELGLYHRRIQSNAESLLSLLNELLDLSQMEAQEIELVEGENDLEVLCQGILEEVSSQKKVGVELIGSLSAGLPLVRCDGRRLRQLLTELLENALRFTERGHVLLRMEGKAKPEGQLDVALSVIDSGVGIEPEEQQLLQQTFTQGLQALAGRTPGLGTGLALARKLVDLMGGTFQLSSQVGKGTIISLRFSMRCVGPPKQLEQHLQGRRVLLIDENPISREAMRQSLSCHGAEVFPTGSGLEAIRWLQSSAPADVIATSHQLPDLDGEALLQALERKAEWVEIPVLMLMNMGEQPPDETLHKRALMFQLKPPGRAALVHSLMRLLGQRQEAASQTPKASTHRILVVDDCADQRALIELFLEKMGFLVTQASCGEDALVLIAKQSFSLILMDVEMGGMNGLQLAQSIRDHEARTGLERQPIVGLSGHSIEGMQRQCLKAGMDDFYVKPIKKSKLQTILTRWIDQRPCLLLVSDSPESVALLRRRMERSGLYRSRTAVDGHEALALMDANAFAAVLLDMEMRDTNSYALCSALHEKASDLPIVALTARASMKERCLQAGCASVLTHPVSKQKLFHALEQCLGRETADQQTTRHELMPLFIEKRHEDVKLLTHALNQRSWRDIREVSQRLQISAKTYGFDELHNVGERLMQAAQDKDEVKVYSVLTLLQRSLGQLTRS